jgi:hypothetical protein
MKLISLLMVAILGLGCSGCLTTLAIYEVKKIHDRKAMERNDQNQNNNQNQDQGQDQNQNNGQGQSSNDARGQNSDDGQ